MDKAEARKVRQNVKRCLDIDGNNKCADCDEDIAAETGWASISFGVTLCVNCAGVHRGIDGNQVRSFSLDSSAWSTTSNVEFFRKIDGNIKANKNVWEHYLPTFYINPKFDKFSHTKNINLLRSLFISNKYEKQVFTPESKGKEKKHNKQRLHIKKMPIDVRQNLLYFYNTETKTFNKKPDYCIVHGQFISRYSSNKIKKNKCTDIETYDLLKLKVVIDDRLHTAANIGLDANEFVFMLYEDNSYIPANVYKMGSGVKKINRIRKLETEIIRIKYIGDFNRFTKIIHDIRATINYHRLYEQLVIMNYQQDEPLIIMNYDLQKACFLGIGKVFNSTKCYFFVINDTLYGLATKKDPRTLFSADDKCAHLNAKYGWNLNKINISLDDNGKRTGSKYALLLILRNKTIFIKYDNGPVAVKFYTDLQKLCIQTKGRYLVNFTSTPPTICGDETEKKDENENENKNEKKEDSTGQMKEKMELLRKKSHHQKCPTQILEIISKIQIDEEINGPIIYEDIIEESESKEVFYEIARQQTGDDLMSLPPAPPNALNQNSNENNFKPSVNESPKQQPPPNPLAAANQPPPNPLSNPMANKNKPPPNPMINAMKNPMQNPMKKKGKKKGKKKVQNQPPPNPMQSQPPPNPMQNQPPGPPGPPGPPPMNQNQPPPNPMQPGPPPPMNMNPMNNMNANPLNASQPPGPPGPPGPPPMNSNPLNNVPPPPMNVSYGGGIKERLRLEQERKKKEYEAERLRIEKEKLEREKEERQALELQKQQIEQERIKMQKELQETKAKMAEEARKRTELEEETRKLKEQQSHALDVPSQIGTHMAGVDKGGIPIGSPKSWEQLEQTMKAKQGIQGLSVEEALAAKWKNQDDDESSSDESSESDYSTDSDYSKVNQNNQAQHQPRQPSNVQQQQIQPGNNDRGSFNNYQQQMQQQQQQQNNMNMYGQQGYGYNQYNQQYGHQKQQGSLPQQQYGQPQQNMGQFGQYAGYYQQQQQQQQQYNQQQKQGQGQKQGPPQPPQQQFKNLESSEEEEDNDSSSDDDWNKAKKNKINNAMMSSNVQKESPIPNNKNQGVKFFKPQQQKQQQQKQQQQKQQQQQQQKPPQNPMQQHNYNGSFSQNNPMQQNNNNPMNRGSFNNYGKPQNNANNGSFSQQQNPNMNRGSFNNYGQPQQQQQQQQQSHIQKPSLNLNNNSSGKGGDRWQCPMCTFENKPNALQCDMCTVERPQATGAQNDGKLSTQGLKKLHKEMTYHYNEYTKMQQLPPLKQQEMHQQMTYHYQQYSLKYKQYQQNQNKPKVVKSRKSKLISGNQMQYLKLQRIFTMNKQQQMTLSNPTNFNTIRQLFGQYARITVVPQNNCYQIAIPNNIPLPRRKDHWQQILQIIRNQIGVSQEM